MTPRTYIDIHVLQTLPPSNVNRDDTGSPKQAIYGGVRRARVSSQAWKRATRQHFEAKLSNDQHAIRTKEVSRLLADRLVERSGAGPEEAGRISRHLLEPLGISTKGNNAATAYLLFFGGAQLDHLADLVADRMAELASLDDDHLDKAIKPLSAQGALATGHPIGVGLFGRMVADLSQLNVDAAVQVAHAISTHAVEVEFDYYTAVDDERSKDSTGAGMIGTVEYNSATLYRFATVGLHQLASNLDGDEDATLKALAHFLESFVRSMPSGHQTSFAHHTLPSFVAVIVRDDQPVNLVSAFESPVVPTGFASGLTASSVQRLVGELVRANEIWGLEPLAVASSYSSPDDEGSSYMAAVLGQPLPFDRAVEKITEFARGRLAS